MIYNRIPVVFGNLRKITIPPVSFQYDIVQKLIISGLELPEYYQVDFCNDGDTSTITMVGTADGVDIPDQFLQTGRTVVAYLVINGTDTGAVETRYQITIPVNKRPTRTDIEPTPEEQGTIDSLIAAMNDAVDDAEASATAAEGFAENAEASAERAEQAAQSIDDKVTRAEAAAQAAGVSATRAEDAAEDALVYKNDAAESAGVASSSAEDARNSKETAIEKAAEAEQSAAQAAASAASAEGDAQEAEQAAQQAEASADAAEQSATAAQGSATAASGSATVATNKAAEASASATTASGKATEAANSATAAQTAQTGAEAAQAAAEAVLESIPEDYSELSEDVDELKNAITQIDVNLFDVPYTPSNMSVDANDKIYLEKGYINASTGATAASSSGKYYRTQVGSNGANTFLLIGDKPLFVMCENVDFAEWNCFSYSGNTSSTATHSNTNSTYQLCSVPIYIPKNDTDITFAITFRTLGTSDAERVAFTDAQITALKNAIKFFVATDSGLELIGKAADAKSVGDELAKINYTQAKFGVCDVCYGMGTNRTSGGVTFTNNGNNTWTVSGTATASTYANIFSKANEFPIGTKVNDRLYINLENNGNVFVSVYKYVNGTLNTSPLFSAHSSGAFTIPSDASGLLIRLRVANGNTTNVTLKVNILNGLINPQLPTKEKKIAFFGDSIMWGRDGSGSSTTRVEQHIPNIVASILNSEYANYGESSLGWIHAGSTHSNAYDLISHTDLTGFDVAVLCFGVNDGFTAIGDYNSTDETTCLGQFNKIIGYLGTTYPNMRVIVFAPFNGSNAGSYPNYWYGTPGGQAYSRGTLSNTLKQACEYYWIPYIEQKDSPINANNITIALPDGVHPNQAYYFKLGDWFAGKLMGLLG